MTAYALWLLNSLYPPLLPPPGGGVTLCSFLGSAHPLVAAGGYYTLLWLLVGIFLCSDSLQPSLWVLQPWP